MFKQEAKVIKVRALKPLNYKGKTITKDMILELEEEVAKKLIQKEAVIELKEDVKTNLNIGDKE